MSTISRRVFIAASGCALLLPSLSRSQVAIARGGTLRVAVDQAASVIHPLLTRVNPEYMVTELLYSNLTRLGQDMSVEPDLAERWQANDDLTRWTFYLRRGVQFHDGTPLTAQDVVETFKTILNPNTASSGRNNVGPIGEIRKTDDHTVVFELSNSFADFPSAVAYTNARIIPAHYATADHASLSSKAVGTGPFVLRQYDPDRIIVVERNPHYYDPRRPYVDRVEIRVFPDVNAESSALVAGDIDIVSTLQPTQYMRLQNSRDVDVLRSISGQFCNINFGCDIAPFNDVRVRRALALTVDRNAMVDFVSEGFGSAGNDTPVSPAYRFYANLPNKTPDIAQAKKLLAEAGYPNGLNATLIASDRPGQRQLLGVAIREMAGPAGFRINVQTMPHATYLDQVWTKGDFYVGFYNMQPTEDAIFKLLYTSDAAWNETRWNNQDFDGLIEKARATNDESARATLYAQAQQMMYDEVPSLIPLFFDVLGAKRRWVNNYRAHPRGSVFRLDFVHLTEDAIKRR